MLWHCLRRTNADKRKAVETLLKDGEWARWSNREIAKATDTHYNYVAKVRDELTITRSDSDKPAARTYTTKHGTTAVMKTENIGGVPCMRETAKWTPLAGSGPAPPGSGKGVAQRYPLHRRRRRLTSQPTSTGAGWAQNWTDPERLNFRPFDFVGKSGVLAVGAGRAQK